MQYRQPRVVEYMARVYKNGYIAKNHLSKKIVSRNVYNVQAPYPTRKIAAQLQWGAH
jgi:hypothetical protein